MPSEESEDTSSDGTVQEAEYAHTTIDKTLVDPPQWASAYEIGDEITWTANGECGTATIVGFSTNPSLEGLPVIEPPSDLPGPDCVETVALTSSDVVGVETVRDHKRTVRRRSEDGRGIFVEEYRDGSVHISVGFMTDECLDLELSEAEALREAFSELDGELDD